MWLTNFSNSSKEELRQSLKAGDGKEICLLGISYSDTQSHSCRSTPKHGGHTLPRCKSYRLCKSTRRGKISLTVSNYRNFELGLNVLPQDLTKPEFVDDIFVCPLIKVIYDCPRKKKYRL